MPRPSAPGGHDLTEREREVLGRLGAGLTRENPGAADLRERP
ncbi:hypothetical protein [Amycolatopsis balhimycina]|nr:hypothetical protein [Amycolatopsis balhimycina]